MQNYVYVYKGSFITELHTKCDSVVSVVVTLTDSHLSAGVGGQQSTPAQQAGKQWIACCVERERERENLTDISDIHVHVHVQAELLCIA